MKFSKKFLSIHLLAVAALLSGGLTRQLKAQVYSPLLDPVSADIYYFTCITNTVPPVAVPNASWSGTTAAFAGTNAHFHGTGPSGSTEPKSSISPSSGTADSSGNFNFYLQTTLISQAEKLNLSCGGYSPVTYEWAVGYGDVYYNDHPTIWIKTGGTTAHGSVSYNRYMTTAAAYGLYDATNDYLGTHTSTTQVCTNDMALPFGGKFDISSTWNSPHISHDRGTAADVAGPNSGSCATANQVVLTDFLNSCVNKGAVAANTIPESFVNSAGVRVYHAHCNFANPNTYPH